MKRHEHSTSGETEQDLQRQLAETALTLSGLAACRRRRVAAHHSRAITQKAIQANRLDPQLGLHRAKQLVARAMDAKFARVAELAGEFSTHPQADTTYSAKFDDDGAPLQIEIFRRTTGDEDPIRLYAIEVNPVDAAVTVQAADRQLTGEELAAPLDILRAVQADHSG